MKRSLGDVAIATQRPKGSRPLWKPALLAVALLLGAAIALQSREPEGQAGLPPSPAAALTVKAIRATAERWPRSLSAVGSIAAWQEVVISAEIGGQRLARLPVDVGDVVKQGQILAELSPGTLQAELDASRAALREAEVNAAEARRAADRARALQGSQALSAQAIDQASAASDAAEARLAAAQARLRADAQRLAYTRIAAPYDGVISVRSALEGALVQAGEELLRLQRQGRLEWRAELPGPELALVAPGQPARLTVDGAGVIAGRVRRVSPQVDAQSRSGLVYVDLEPAPGLRAGLFARGELLLGEREVLTLPHSAVLLRDGSSYVFRIDGEAVRQQPVTLGARRADRVEVLEGLDAGTAVVERGVAFLVDGLRVRLAPATPALSLASGELAP